MPDYWLTMLDEDNFRYTVERGIYGLPEGAGDEAKLIKPGDRLVVYIMKKGCRELCQSFTAVLEVAGEWQRSKKPTWPDEVREGRVKYPWVVNVKVLIMGKVEFAKIKEKLQRLLGIGDLDPSRLRLYALYYARRPLPPGVGELVEAELRKSAAAEMRTHDKLVDILVEVGRWLGFRAVKEYRIDNFRVDVAFFKPPRTTPFAVAEVHVGGDVYKDLAALKHAYDRYGSKLVYVLARDEEQVAKLLNEALQGAFHEIGEHIAVVKAEELHELHETLKLAGVKGLLKQLEVAKPADF
ncbi:MULTISPECIES: EVE domain-containing protein [Pyrobaculum]|uniref:EVE domain-containing protein n=2 Tax=Pyrobaculum arsenaticum TaxID=121277 RepID=A4WL01_PYRAR|nr:EVE domain-containing protein [Pyrobaculum arsenaticum]ABP51068.1 protein of unknown function DUF55 [Pyrobaculum arsenaticum DSM 13514]MCY0891696.1 EVE domain-containing protein [Pyrobaculum arsenaticum]NYR15206.1 EVE domain-containing protein [Pyrobaculum arsenaticum]